MTLLSRPWSAPFAVVSPPERAWLRARTHSDDPGQRQHRMACLPDPGGHPPLGRDGDGELAERLCRRIGGSLPAGNIALACAAALRAEARGDDEAAAQGFAAAAESWREFGVPLPRGARPLRPGALPVQARQGVGGGGVSRRGARALRAPWGGAGAGRDRRGHAPARGARVGNAPLPGRRAWQGRRVVQPAESSSTLSKRRDLRACGAGAYAAVAAHMTAAGRRLRPLRYRSWTPSERFGVPGGLRRFRGHPRDGPVPPLRGAAGPGHGQATRP